MDASTRNEPQNLTVRAPRPEDAEAVAELLRASDVLLFGEPDSDVADVRDEWAHPGFDLARDAWLTQAQDGTLRAYAFVRAREDGKDYDGDIRTLPGDPVAPLTAPLLARLEARVREKAAPSTPAVCFFTATVEREMRELLEAAGYDHVRTFFRMRIDLVPEKMVKPSLPTNVEIRPLRVGQDERELHAVIEESFAQHFRHTERSFEDWWAARGRHEKFDPALFLLAWDGNRVAGGIVAYDFGDIGFVRELGVRSAWRGRNLGLALLLRSFESFLAKGQRRVALGVDAENENALGLYLRAGMWEDSRHLVLRRMLAP